jgi:hypothetical protein
MVTPGNPGRPAHSLISNTLLQWTVALPSVASPAAMELNRQVKLCAGPGFFDHWAAREKKVR